MIELPRLDLWRFLILDKMKYPKMFITGIIPKEKSRRDLINDALLAWKCTKVIYPPEKFGSTMAKIGTILGSDMWPENLEMLLKDGGVMIIESCLN